MDAWPCTYMSIHRDTLTAKNASSLPEVFGGLLYVPVVSTQRAVRNANGTFA